MTLAEFLDRFPSRRKAGNGWLVLCPAHNDRDGSLSVTEKQGKILVNCQAGDPGDRVVAALGLTWKDLRTTEDPRPARRIVCTYDYRDLDGTLRYQKVRYDPKDFRQRRPDGAGGWVWNLQGIPTRVLYRLPDLKAAP
jgi:putative DNA primase/helicase